jgi:hypothetical protein
LVVDGRFTRELVVDEGTLVVQPAAAGTVPVVTLSIARTLVGAAQSGEGEAWQAAQVIGFGIVSIDTSITKGLPSYDKRAAWVALVPGSPDVRFAAATAPQPSFEMIVLDADSGADVLVYRTAGLGLCGGPADCTPVLHGPSVEAATEIVSVPWTATQRPDPYNTGRLDWVVSYNLPSCAVIFDSPGVYWTRGVGGPVDLYVDLEEPMDPARSCPPPHLGVSVFGPETTPISQVGHAPLGAGTSSPTIPTTPAAPAASGRRGSSRSSTAAAA